MPSMTLGNPLPVQSARRSTRSPEAEENPTRHKIVIGDARRLVEKLPYVCKDPVRMQQQADPEKLQFGSKLDDSARMERLNYASE